MKVQSSPCTTPSDRLDRPVIRDDRELIGVLVQRLNCTGGDYGFDAVNTTLLVTISLAQRDIVRFLRQRTRVIGGLLTPIVFWVLLGFGIGRSFRPPGWTGEIDYADYFFPGTLLLILLFTAIFSTVSVIEDRREGFLQGVLVSPAPIAGAVLGKLLGGAVLAMLHGVVFLLLAPVAGISVSLWTLPLLLGFMALDSLMLTALGLAVAWPMESTQGFHAVMNLLLIPLWLLSGALFPMEGAATWVRVLMRINPVHYAYSGLQASLLPTGTTIPTGVAAGVTILFLILLVAVVLTSASRARN